MIRYKVVKVTGSNKEIAEVDSKEFTSIYSARKEFDSVDIYMELLNDWWKSSEVVHKILINQDAFLEYDLVEYDTKDEFYKINLGRKSMSFQIFNK